MRRREQVEEIAAEPRLQLMAWSLLFSYLLTFREWAKTDFLSPAKEAFRAVLPCWPHLPRCEVFQVLGPDGLFSFSTLLFVALAALVFCGAHAAFEKEWSRVMAVLRVLFGVHFLGVLVVSARFATNFHYFLLLVGGTFLFARARLASLRVLVVVFYFLAALVKMRASWVGGTYFLSLEGGMLGLPAPLVILVCNCVIFLETVLGWWLLAPAGRRRSVALALFVIFHLFSAVYVGYFYPTLCLPVLLILFWPMGKREREVPLVVGRGFLWFLAALFLLQFHHAWQSAQRPYSTQFTRYGLHMFDENHQCISRVRYVGRDGVAHESIYHSVNSFTRCAEFDLWGAIRAACRDGRFASASWQLDRSNNGGAYYRVVEEEDACRLAYHWPGRNSWLRDPGADARPVAYPRRNFPSLDPRFGVHAFDHVNEAYLFRGSEAEFRAYRDLGVVEPWLAVVPWISSLWAGIWMATLLFCGRRHLRAKA